MRVLARASRRQPDSLSHLRRRLGFGLNSGSLVLLAAGPPWKLVGWSVPYIRPLSIFDPLQVVLRKLGFATLLGLVPNYSSRMYIFPSCY